MTLRTTALTVAILSTIGLAGYVYVFLLDVFGILHSTNSVLWMFGIFVPAAAQSVFFILLYAESSGRIKPPLRSIAATTAAVLTVPAALYVVYQIHASAALATDPHATAPRIVGGFAPLMLASQCFLLVNWLLWVAFLVAFGWKTRSTFGRAIPKLAAALLFSYVAFYGLSWYIRIQVHLGRPLSATQIHASWFHAWLFEVFTALDWASVPALFAFLAVVWRRWQTQLSVQENVQG